MFGNETSPTNLWLMIDASLKGVLRFATAIPSPRPELRDIRSINIEGVPTFTDALQRFEHESGIPLRGTPCVMAVGGATSGETLSPVRSRWTITRAGLAAIFGQPITIINDVAARAWAAKSEKVAATTVRGSGVPDLGRGGRFIMMNVDEGLGAAAVDADPQLGIRILETEAGHTDFGAVNEREEKLAKAVRGASPTVSWETMLMLDVQSPVWAQACPGLAESEKFRMLAYILGRFAVNMMHAYGAWDGILITGTRGSRLLDSSNRIAFEDAFRDRRNFGRLVSTCPVWLIHPHESVLTGAAQCLAEQQGYSLRKAA
jgi:glucokinase